MKIGIVSSSVPLVNGGYRLIADWLEEALRARGHSVETIYIPSTDDPNTLLRQMASFRMIKLDDYYEHVITLRPPAHMVSHPRKSVWFIHHIRIFYDLWAHPYSPMPDLPAWRALRDNVIAADTIALKGARGLFTNSRVVADRLRSYNGLSAEVLYPPVSRPERFRPGPYTDEIVCVCRMEHHKRQHLLVDAMSYTRSGVRLRLCGVGLDPAYISGLRSQIAKHDLGDRVVIEERWISEEEKVERFASALAGAYVPVDEDSYGYPTLEAAHARRATVTVADSGGVLEFINDDETGLVAEPSPEALAIAFDRLHADRALARRLGEAAEAEIGRLGITWDRVVERLLA